ncbi:MAG: MSCRAMM family adhesin SdrC [Lachnospiraceae bacterium]|nr:MSCRAMM family adhesin SdrC [Lachnospiraceae bacterium]
MKGVVLEVRDGCSAILLEDGTVVKRPTTYGIGETVDVSATVAKMPAKSRLSRIVAAVAAFTVVFTGGGTYAYLDATAMSQISLDVNPSLEYELNHFDKIVSVRDENDDAREVVEQLYEEGVKGDTLTEALAKTEDILKDLGYLAEEDDPYILVSVCSGSQKKYAQLTAEIESQLSSEAYNVTVYAISEENKKEADELGLSGGRYAVMKSDEERLTASADDKEQKAAVPKLADPVEYYKTSAVRTLIEGTTEDSLTIDDDDTIVTEVADTDDEQQDAAKDQPGDAATDSDTSSPATDIAVASGSEETIEEAPETDTDKQETADKPGKADEESTTDAPADADTGAGGDDTGEEAVTVTTEETVSSEDDEEIVSTGDDEVDGDEPIDTSKLG